MLIHRFSERRRRRWCRRNGDEFHRFMLTLWWSMEWSMVSALLADFRNERLRVYRLATQWHSRPIEVVDSKHTRSHRMRPKSKESRFGSMRALLSKHAAGNTALRHLVESFDGPKKPMKEFNNWINCVNCSFEMQLPREILAKSHKLTWIGLSGCNWGKNRG